MNEFTYTVNIVLKNRAVSFAESWVSLKNLVEKYDLVTDCCELYHESISFNEVADKLRKEKTGYNIQLSDISIRHAIVKRFGYDLILIKTHTFEDLYLNGFIRDTLTVFCEEKGFIQSWVVDTDFDYWQNEDLIDTYKKHGREIEHLKTCEDDFGDLVIDTSANPGRRVLRKGFIEGIGSEMCFGSKFWCQVDRPETELDKFELLEKKELTNGSVFVSFSEKPFSDESDMQRLDAIRRGLYG